MRGAEHVEDPHTVSKLRKRRGGVSGEGREPQGLEAQPLWALNLRLSHTVYSSAV